MRRIISRIYYYRKPLFFSNTLFVSNSRYSYVNRSEGSNIGRNYLLDFVQVEHFKKPF